MGQIANLNQVCAIQTASYMKKTMQKIQLHDLSFIGDKTSSKLGDSKYIEWNRVVDPNAKTPIVFTDMCLGLARNYTNNYKIAWIVEPYCINPMPYIFVQDNLNLFDLVLTHHKSFITVDPDKIKLYQFCGVWLKPEDRKIWPKNKNISIIASNKNATVGHRLRHEIIAATKSAVDVFGGGYVPLENKITGLKDYRYQLVIENCSEPGYFSEKLIDCLLTGTIPIYYGDPDIKDYFDIRGIIQVNSLREITALLNELKAGNNGELLYKQLTEPIQKNFEIAQQFLCAEDNIWENHLKELYETK